MAFDQATRNRLSKFVSDTRKLLSDEFSQQMRVKYGLDPVTGVVTDIDKLPTMAEGDRQTAQMLRDTLEHYLATAPKRDKKTVATTIDRIVREQAFTVLNRLCAVRMAESRELVIESIAQGTKSKGFQLYARLAGSALGETGEAYVSFLFSLFDELSIDLPVLFDRFSPSGRLFPRGSVLLEVLGQINHHELQHLWAEDETIGWIYQYFNSQEERKAMRDASSAPRNSRELAVRNQFFTPRYVVEFLTDNTLGRIWYEMTQGQTRLVDDCKYLVRRPDEVFLSHMTSKDQEHPSEGTIAMAELLLTGTEENFPEFKADDPQPMIELAHCVSAYATMGDRAHEILGNGTQIVRERSIHDPSEIADAIEAAPYVFAGQLETLKTQNILEVLFMTCRSDRHGGDGSVYSEPWFVDACNELRRRVLYSRRDDLSQDELLRQPVFIPYRPMKDPRDIKMLDPACGSMHFGLYAFDLFLSVYEEAWELEERLGDQAFVRSRELKSLRESYGTRERYMLDVPRLIIERNIHGVDIDARAVQIAGLSLWLRAQKAWHEAEVKPAARPQITRSNIVCAEPMPGESDLLEQFITEHLSETSEQQTIASIVRRVFDAMKLAGEVGSLLKIEAEIAETIAEAKKKWVEGPKALQLPLFAIDAKHKDSGARPLLVAGIDDASFWDEIEERIYNALQNYGEKAGGGFKRRLFTNDAAQGFAFIDLCRKRYEVVLMNPPFGDSTTGSTEYLKRPYPLGWQDLFRAFVERLTSTLASGGLAGSVGPRPPLYLIHSEAWRRSLLLGELPLYGLADLGIGVLDDALVEACAYLLTNTNRHSQSFFIRAIKSHDKVGTVSSAIQDPRRHIANRLYFLRELEQFKTLPQSAIAYWVSPAIGLIFKEKPASEGVIGEARVGLQTSDDFRFVRARWEVPLTDGTCTWRSFAKGGEYSPFYSDIHLVVNWKHEGREVCVFNEVLYGSASRNVRSKERYGEFGITWSPRTTTEFAPRVLPANCIFGQKGPAFLTDNESVAAAALAVTNSRVYQYLMTIGAGAAEIARGSSSKSYGVGLVQTIPVPDDIPADVADKSIKCFSLRRNYASSTDVTCADFNGFPVSTDGMKLRQWCESLIKELIHSEAKLLQTWEEMDRQICRLYGLTDTVHEEVKLEVGSVLGDAIFSTSNDTESVDPLKSAAKDIDTFDTSLFGILRRFAATTQQDLESAEIQLCGVASKSKQAKYRLLSSFIDYLVGVAFSRFSTTNDYVAECSSPFSPIAKQSPAENRMENSTRSKLVFTSDPSCHRDISRAVESLLISWFPDDDDVLLDVASLLGKSQLRDWINSVFFDEHLRRHSKSRRQAPLYWPISTKSGLYTVWIYYHNLDDQTLFSVVNDLLDPKIKELDHQVKALNAKADKSRLEHSELERLGILASELTEFRTELLRVAKIWKPNRDDGVQITAAPLWQFFVHSKWRETLKKTWADLVDGKYEWAHIAFYIWPDRVVRTAHKDRSVAIAHDLEGLLWHEVEIKKTSKTGRVTSKVEWQPRELSEKELDAIAAKVKSGEIGCDNAAPEEVANG